MSQKEPNEDKERIEKNSEQKYDGCFLTVFFRNLMKVKKISVELSVEWT